MAPVLLALIEVLWRKFRDAAGACVVMLLVCSAPRL